MTRYEQIKNMTIEEMADFILWVEHIKKENHPVKFDEIRNGHIEWLKQEAENDGQKTT